MIATLKIPTHSAILPDTNVLVDAIEHGHSFAELISAFQAVNATPSFSEIVRLEFLRGSEKHDKALQFIEIFFGNDPFTLRLDDRVYELAYDIDKIYRRRGNKKVGIGDLLIAAQIARFSLPKREKNHLLLATQNHKDFSPVLFDLLDVVNIRIQNGVIKTVGLYQFSAERFEQLRPKS